MCVRVCACVWGGGCRKWRVSNSQPCPLAPFDLDPLGVTYFRRYLNLSAEFWLWLPLQPGPILPLHSPPIILSQSILTVLSIIHNINIHSMAKWMDGEDIGGPSFQYWSPLEGVNRWVGDGVIASCLFEAEPQQRHSLIHTTHIKCYLHMPTDILTQASMCWT